MALVEIMTHSEIYKISHDNNYYYILFYNEDVLKEWLERIRMSVVCENHSGYPGIW